MIIQLLIFAGAIGAAGTLVVALMMLSQTIGVAGVAGLVAYVLGFALLLIATREASSRTGVVWILLCAIPLPAAIAVFFALRALGL